MFGGFSGKEVAVFHGGRPAGGAAWPTGNCPGHVRLQERQEVCATPAAGPQPGPAMVRLEAAPHGTATWFLCPIHIFPSFATDPSNWAPNAN